MRLSRTGGYADAEIIVDGGTMIIRNKAANRFAQMPAQGGIDALIEALHQQAGLAVPAADLLLRDSYAVLVDDVIEAKVIGEGVVGGQVCDHLAFRNFETDWQIWIRQGPEKAPCKMVITSKTVGMAPQYTMHVRSWATPAGFPADTFAFRPAAGETRVEPNQLGGIDEIPPPSTENPK